MRKCEDKCEWDAVKDLEERWHKIRLRVLEWQYFLEGLTWTSSSNKVSEEYTVHPTYKAHGYMAIAVTIWQILWWSQFETP